MRTQGELPLEQQENRDSLQMNSPPVSKAWVWSLGCGIARKSVQSVSSEVSIARGAEKKKPAPIPRLESVCSRLESFQRWVRGAMWWHWALRPSRRM